MVEERVLEAPVDGQFPDGFRDTVTRYIAEVDRLHMELLRVCATAAGLDDVEFFARCATRNDNTLNVNWYPPLHHVGKPLPHQYRIGPHTDFGTLTVLHREPGSSALEVQLPDGAWVHAPVVDDTFTINGGDMLAHWSSGRWRSAIHRMLPPTGAAAERSLLSLVYFCEPDPETMITPLGGGTAVNAGTNGSVSDETFARIMAALPPDLTPLVVFLTVKAPRGWIADNNTRIRALAAQYPNVKVVDWEAEAQQILGELSTSDGGIHLRTAYAKQFYANLIFDAIGRPDLKK